MLLYKTKLLGPDTRVVTCFLGYLGSPLAVLAYWGFLKLSFSKMRFSTLAIALASSAVTSLAAPSPNKHVLHEKRDGLPHLWEKRDRAIRSQVLPIRIGLRQRNLENAEKYIHEVSDPNSPNFGMLFRYLSSL